MIIPRQADALLNRGLRFADEAGHIATADIALYEGATLAGLVIDAGRCFFENYVGQSFPTGCKAELNDREKVMAFLLFDLASCVVSDLVPPTPPAVIK